MIGVGIDVSKLKSTICIMNEYGEVLHKPYEITHTETDLKKLSKQIKGYGGKSDVRVVMEATGAYSTPVLYYLLDEDIFVAQINPLAMKKYRSDINFRGVKNDAIDAVAIAQYAVEKWNRLKEYKKADEEYDAMKALSRQYLTYMKPHVALTQNLDHLVDQVMPGIKNEFKGYDPVTGTDRLSDFLEEFRHYDYITSLGPKRFEERFAKWAEKKGYRPRHGKSGKIYSLAKEGIPTLAYDSTSRLLVEQAVAALKSMNQVLYTILAQIRKLAVKRPEYPVVRAMSGVSDILAPLLVAEVGDPRRYHSGDALIACIGIDVPPYESGQFKASERRITRKGSKQLRKLGYLVVKNLRKIKPTQDTAVYDYYLKKIAEGKKDKQAIVAGMNKFFRIYYARAMETYRECEESQKCNTEERNERRSRK
jgi:transposase